MATQENLSNNKKFSKEIVYYFVCIGFVISLSIFPKIELKDPWYRSYSLIEASLIEKAPEIKDSLLNTGGEELLELLNKHPYHGRINLMVAYYYFLKKMYDSSIFYSKKAYEVGSGGLVERIDITAIEVMLEAAKYRTEELFLEADTSSAVQLYRDFLEISPDNPDIIRSLGLIYARSGFAEEAIPHLKKSLSFKQNDTNILLNLAKCYQMKQMNDSAGYFAQAVLKIEPKNELAKKLLSTLQ